MFNQRKDLVPIAHVTKSNGADGEVVFSMKDLDPDGLEHTEPVFIVFDGSPVPFFIESLTPRGNRKALVRLQGVSSMEDVGEIVGKDVFAEASSLPQNEDEEDGAFLVGWTLYDCTEIASPEGTSVETKSAKRSRKKKISLNNCREIGEITDFIDIPNNPCIEVSTKNGAVLLPLHEDLIVSINEASRSIVMSVPSGLI
ncbi:MAG: hypothetical protein LUD72_09710 [Bacteroidales bacterium]|nr:hypothetical protein [Bacteroidales bacterium]